jgi:SAM-dependent methyltransferase
VDAPLHTLDPTGRFADRARDYALYRPGYAAAAVDAVLAGLGDPCRLMAADVGAGTGISTRLLGERGVRVVGIEPNAAMRERAEPHAMIEWREGRAEATGLEAGSMDLVLSAQAFHWFEPQSALTEFARVLRRGGRLALLWNEGDRSDRLTSDYYALVNESAGDSPVLKVRGAPEAFWASALFVSQREHAFGHVQELDEAGLIGRALSASYVPKEGPRREALEAGLREAFRRTAGEGGRGWLHYTTRGFIAERG